MYQKILQIDAHTGEQLEGTIALRQPKKTNGYKMWIALNQESMDALCSADLTGYDRRVLIALACNARQDNQILVSQKALADRLGIAATHVSRSIANLVEKGFISRGERIGTTTVLWLNFEHFWRGDSIKHKRMVSDLRRSQIKQAREQVA